MALGTMMAVSAGTSLLGSMMSSDAASSAAKQQTAAAQQAAEIQAKQRQPWVDAGTEALKRLQTGLAPGGEYAQKFTMADAANSPAQQFAMEQGLGALQQSAASKAGLLGTGTLQDMTKFAEGEASQFEGQAFNQWLQQQQMQLGAQQSLAQIGQTNVGAVADAASNAALAAGGAQAGATVAGANAMGSALGGIGQNAMNYGIYNKLFSTPTSSIPMEAGGPG
jgi:hypothetical protein